MAVQRGSELLLGGGHDDRGVIDRKRQVPELVERRAVVGADLLEARLELVDQALERVGVVRDPGGQELALGAGGRQLGDPGDERIAEQRLDVGV